MPPHPTLPVYRSGSVPGVASLHDSRDALADQEKNLKLGLTEYGWPFLTPRHISAVLRQTDWVIDGPRGAAQILGLHPNILRSRLKKLGLTRSSHEPS